MLALCLVGTAERALIHFRMHWIGLLVLANFAYWLITGFASGGVGPGDLASPAFFNNDGRVFLYYLPLLFFACAQASDQDLHRAARAVVYIVGTSLALMVVWALTSLSWLSVGGQNWYGGLLTSHTGAGTFFGVLAVWLFVYGDVMRAPNLRLLGLLGAVPMFATGSRQALVSLAAVLVWYVLRIGRGIVIVRTAVVAVILTAMLSVAVPKLVERTAVIFSPQTFSAVVDIASRAKWEPSVLEPLGGVESNILSRIVLWKYAVRRFSESPVLGVGFARYNDPGLRLQTAGVASLAVRGDRATNVYNAHNMYLHLLAESGVVGLCLLLAVWVGLWREMRRGERELPTPLRAYYLACQAALVFTAVSASFDNALAAPSVGLPVLALTGLALARGRTSTPWRALP